VLVLGLAERGHPTSPVSLSDPVSASSRRSPADP
jgi:hypothetical protein